MVVGHNGLGDGLADGVDLRCVSAARHAHADVYVREFVESDGEERFVDLDLKCMESVGGVGTFFWVVLGGDRKMGGKEGRTLKRRISGWVRARGLPLTFTRPLPA